MASDEMGWVCAVRTGRHGTGALWTAVVVTE